MATADRTLGGINGPVVGGLDPEERGSFFARFTPKMTFLMSVLAAVTITAGILTGLNRGFPNSVPWLALLTAATTIPVVVFVGCQFDALADRKALSEFGMPSPLVVATPLIVTLRSVQGCSVVFPGEVGTRNAKLGGLQGATQLAIVFVVVGLRYGRWT